MTVRKKSNALFHLPLSAVVGTARNEIFLENENSANKIILNSESSLSSSACILSFFQATLKLAVRLDYRKE